MLDENDEPEIQASTVVGELRLEPDYKNIFAMFLNEAKMQAHRLVDQARPATDQVLSAGEMLREFQTVLAPLNIALQSATSSEQVYLLRDALADITKRVQLKSEELNTIDSGDPWTPAGVNRKGLL